MREAVITVAENMSDETYRYLCDGINQKFGGGITFRRQVDHTVIGGFVLALEGMVYDMSLKTQMDELKKHISE